MMDESVGWWFTEKKGHDWQLTVSNKSAKKTEPARACLPVVCFFVQMLS